MIKTDKAEAVYTAIIKNNIPGVLVYYDKIKEVRTIKDRDTQEFIIVDFAGKLPHEGGGHYICFTDGLTGNSFIVQPETEINYVLPVQHLL